MSRLLAAAPSTLCTVQDMGRQGWRRFGLTSAGAMDPEALAAANVLVGNELDAAAIEFAHAGGDWMLEGEARSIAVAGAAFAITIDDQPVAAYTSQLLHPGQVLRISGSRDGVWGYLAVAGALCVPQEYGSRSTHVRTGVGGMQGRPLRAGDAIPLGEAAKPHHPWRLLLPPAVPDAPIRVVMGPQSGLFAPEADEIFLTARYTVSWQTDRTGYRLEGPLLPHADGFNIVSDGVLPGSIQVPGTQQPIVLLRDVQTIGGFPKIATVVSADLGRLAQHRPRSQITFQQLSLDDAHLLRREYLARLQATRLRLSPVARRAA